MHEANELELQAAQEARVAVLGDVEAEDERLVPQGAEALIVRDEREGIQVRTRELLGDVAGAHVRAVGVLPHLLERGVAGVHQLVTAPDVGAEAYDEADDDEQRVEAAQERGHGNPPERVIAHCGRAFCLN